jgi:hypothetical protein
MASIGQYVRPKKLTNAERQKLQERMDRIMEERDRRRAIHGPIDVAALLREVRSERIEEDETGR